MGVFLISHSLFRIDCLFSSRNKVSYYILYTLSVKSIIHAKSGGNFKYYELFKHRRSLVILMKYPPSSLKEKMNKNIR